MVIESGFGKTVTIRDNFQRKEHTGETICRPPYLHPAGLVQKEKQREMFALLSWENPYPVLLGRTWAQEILAEYCSRCLGSVTTSPLWFTQYLDQMVITSRAFPPASILSPRCLDHPAFINSSKKYFASSPSLLNEQQ